MRPPPLAILQWTYTHNPSIFNGLHKNRRVKACQLNLGMKKYLAKYVVEFFVVVTGVLISFYVEKHRASAYKEDLKNHSLSRLKANIEADIADSWINHRIHSKAVDACRYLIENHDAYHANHRDSIGHYLSIASKSWTIFIDNPEEYLTLRNSGLIELVENDSLIMLLQQKYSSHQVYKQYESHIYVTNDELVRVFNQKTSGRDLIPRSAAEPLIRAYGSLNQGQELTDADLNLIRSRLELSSSYRRDILIGIERDSLILQNLHDAIR